MTSWCRAPAKRRLVELAEFAFDGLELLGQSAVVPVFYGTPSSDFAGSGVFLDTRPRKGATRVDAITRATRKLDVFDIDGDVFVSGYSTPEDAEEAAEQVVRALDAVLIASHRLVHPSVPMTIDQADELAGVSLVVLSDVTGPGHVQPSGDECIGRYTFTIAITATIQ